MLCDNCINKAICKYYAFLVDAPLEVKIESCEKFVPKQPIQQQQQHIQNSQFVFKEPIDYSKFETKDDIVLLSNEEEEKITVDLSQAHDAKVVSITDLLLGEDEDNE